ncbi:hypothetical protein [Cohaesibacter sp. ES.047]|uniref:hypothetical protein n=1 Tax=Cohaesibacter sp. ES.047 TaxID=1798205 RepID=UPI0012FD5EFB|nr:hypothetical protein [Cohaesibacter sp. ES.047]
MATISSGARARQAYKSAIRKQKQAWFEKQASCDTVLCLRYDEIWDRLPEVAQHLDIDDPDFIASFPPQRQRTGVS